MAAIAVILIFPAVVLTYAEPLFGGLYPGLKDEIFDQSVQFMNPGKSPHLKSGPEDPAADLGYAPYDFNKFDEYLEGARGGDQGLEHNRIKRRAKRRRGRGGRRHGSPTTSSTAASPRDDKDPLNTADQVDGRRHSKKKKKKGKRTKDTDKFDTFQAPEQKLEDNFVEMPKDLYQAHLRPGVIFRIHMAEAILKMQYRSYGEDKDESVIEADVEYLRLTRKVISDEITKFEDLRWLTEWFTNRSDLIQEHVCNTRYYAVGIPPTMFTHPEEYMKRMCLFDSVYLDHIPYVIGEDNSLMAAVAPPVLHCDAATCTSVPFIDSLMFSERLQRTSVHTVTRCQASCRAHCRNDADCLKRCSDRCLRAD